MIRVFYYSNKGKALYKSGKIETVLYGVIEPCDKGNLFEHIMKHQRYTEDQA